VKDCAVNDRAQRLHTIERKRGIRAALALAAVKDTYRL